MILLQHKQQPLHLVLHGRGGQKLLQFLLCTRCKPPKQAGLQGLFSSWPCLTRQAQLTLQSGARVHCSSMPESGTSMS